MVKITETEPGYFSVNGKLVYKDMNGKWVSNSELTLSEEKELQRHLEALKLTENRQN